MRDHKPSYCSHHIAFWPVYSAGKTGIIYFSLIALIAFLLCLWELCDNNSRTINWWALFSLLLVIALYSFLFMCIYKAMHQHITITHTGIYIDNIVSNVHETISWEEVTSISFDKDGWYGREYLNIDFKKPTNKVSMRASSSMIFISVDAVDKYHLLEFIPCNLYLNNSNTNRIH